MQSYDFFNGIWPLFAGFTTFILCLVLIDVTLKAVALWKAARADQMGWFIALIIFNTVGILPVIYLLFFMRKAKIKAVVEPVKKIAPKTNKRSKR